MPVRSMCWTRGVLERETVLLYQEFFHMKVPNRFLKVILGLFGVSRLVLTC